MRRATATSASGGERGNHRDIKARKVKFDDGLPEHEHVARTRVIPRASHSESRQRAGRHVTFMATLLDPTSREYKRARRHHYKATKNRAEGLDTEWTPFRAAEKKYKARFPPPDLSDVLDLALLDATRSAEIEQAVWKGSVDTVEVQEIGLKDELAANNARVRKAFTVTGMPGG